MSMYQVRAVHEWEKVLGWDLDDTCVMTAAEATKAKTFFEDNPDQLQKENRFCELPIHHAIEVFRGEHATALVLALITAYPASVQHMSTNAGLPLHVAAEHQRGDHGLVMVKALLAADPGGAQVLNDCGDIPFWVARDAGSDPSIINLLRVPPNDITFSLSIVCRYPPRHSSRVLLHSNPCGIMPPAWSRKLRWTHDRHASLTPLSLEEAQRARLFFLENPQELMEPDCFGCLPVHYLASRLGGKYAVVVVEELLRANSDMAKHKDASGCIALHDAVSSVDDKYRVKMVEALLAAYPDGAQIKNNGGRLPLHDLAFYANGAHIVTITRMLLKVYPQGAKEVDRRGIIPLCAAAECQRGDAGLAMAKALLAAHPESVSFAGDGIDVTFQGRSVSDDAVAQMLKDATKSLITG